MEYVACAVPAAPIRKKASHKSEMINQLLFGETMQVIKNKKQWFKILSMHDHYEGWIRSNQVEKISEELADGYTNWITAGLLNPVRISGTIMNVSFGSSLLGYSEHDGQFGNLNYQFFEKPYNRNEVIPDESLVTHLTKQWLHSPYLWGGRTPLGVDCSGFVQVVFKMMGVELARDAWQQSRHGSKVDKLQNSSCGDLAFFHDDEEIVHVGIILSKTEIIHAAGKVRIDQIDKKGIINSDTGKRTHRLKIVRRYF
jgi:gamma-D-glutamyl-L-lysine dipeptidyl-peptidase